ncbi:MAG TPA: tyrosine-type recombinase/integrase [Bacteroidia bacterium]|jgi:integrase|nr:tyrosine-type recombinase/integrase [Bacteroidia bacterium]
MKNTLIYKHKTTFGTVFLKSRKNGLNPQSLYLEIYLKATQKRHLEFLGLHFTGNPTMDGKIKQDAIGKCINYVFTEKKTIEMTFTSFCMEQTLKIDNLKSRNGPFRSLKKLHLYAKTENVSFNQINESFLLGFRHFLLNTSVSDNYHKKPLSKGTADLYMATIMCYANRAQRKGLIPLSTYSPKDIPCIGQVVKVPVTITEEELIKLQSTPYPKQEICKALMFQFACGQRWGDVKDMTWEQLVLEDGQYMITLQQEKTDKVLPSFISKDLINWVGQGKERKGKIFTDIPLCAGTIIWHMNEWCKSAGITKRVGTHTMRRTCATILYKKGVELLTISKILGHSTTDITRRYIGIDEKDIKKGLDKLKEVTNRFNFGKAA